VFLKKKTLKAEKFKIKRGGKHRSKKRGNGEGGPNLERKTIGSEKSQPTRSRTN